MLLYLKYHLVIASRLNPEDLACQFPRGSRPHLRDFLPQLASFICVLKRSVLQPSLTVKVGGGCSSSSSCASLLQSLAQRSAWECPRSSAPLTASYSPAARFRTPSEPALHPPSVARNPTALLYDRPDGK